MSLERFEIPPWEVQLAEGCGDRVIVGKLANFVRTRSLCTLWDFVLCPTVDGRVLRSLKSVVNGGVIVKCKIIVREEIDSSYVGKNGRVNQRSLIMYDQSDGKRLIQPLEYVMAKDEEAAWSGKCDNRVGTLEVLEIRSVFGGRPQISRGTIVWDK